ncbi:hypothetical protein FXO38_03999 [Capsicum annuum]|nr:hypothetical protein FXO37_07103 [Capsicum annuum]KAF3677031.1 hypothetical protein FXO38_03999 [Capsicum annuum]
MNNILRHCHDGAVKGHYGGRKTTTKVLKVGFFWPTLFKDARNYVTTCDKCQGSGNISKRDEMPLNYILVCEIFDIWGINFMGLANFTQRMVAQWNYNESTFFPLFDFVDPSTCLIPRCYSLKELTQMELIKEQPQPPSDVDNSWFGSFKFDDFDHYDDMVSNWLDLNDVVTISSPMTTPTLGGITIREPNFEMRRAKKPRENEGKENNTMEEEEEDSSNDDNEASIQVFEVVQSSMMHPKEQGENFVGNTQDGGGS